MTRRCAPLLAAVLAATSVHAAEVELRGPLVQGGLIVGRAPEAAAVRLDGQPVRLAPDGHFLLGFGRDAPPTAVLEIHTRAGAVVRQSLAITGRDYEVSHIDGLPGRQVSPASADLERIRAERARIDAVRRRDRDGPDFLSGFRWPLQGRISGVFGSQRILNGAARQPHNGVDIVAPAGTLVRAPADGVVVLAEEDHYFTGHTLMLDHGHGLTTLYAHLDRLLAGAGARVRQGEPIGAVGATGRATGPHLHWGVNLFETGLDPALLAGPMPAGG